MLKINKEESQLIGITVEEMASQVSLIPNLSRKACGNTAYDHSDAKIAAEYLYIYRK